MSREAIDALIGDRRIVIFAGTGGVGKTTCSASLARRAARDGRRVAVLTIDPAKRLADALGVRTDDDAGAVVGGLSNGEGSLHVFALDSQRTFDQLVDRFSPDERTRTRILENPLYQQIVTSIAGSAEYAAMDRVYQLADDDRFDLLVVDTPPAEHALDFLEAPGRIAGFLDSPIVSLLVQPTLSVGRFGLRLFEGSARRVLGLLERVSGLSFLEDLSELLIAIESLAEGLHGRAQELGALLRSDACRFVLVASPTADGVRRADAFLDQLVEARLSVAGVIANRVRTWPGTDDELASLAGDTPPDDAALVPLASALGDDGAHLARAAVDLASGYASQVMLDRATLRPLEDRITGLGAWFVVAPELAEDVYDLAGLDAFGERLGER